MSTEDYRRALEAAVREYEALGEQRQQIDRRLAELAQTLSTLSRLCGIVPTVSVGLTDACRLVLRGAGLPLTPTEVRERLKSFGFDLTRYTNDLAAVHTTLKRLNDAGEVRFIARPGTGDKAYVWDRPARAALLGPDIASVMREMDEKRKAPRTSRKKPS
jgi:predicted transcriptional regulator